MSETFLKVAVIVLLVLSTLLAADRFVSRKDQADYSTASNQVSQDLLAPRLLDDRAASEKYLSAFPSADYKVYEVFGIGKFYIDLSDDLIKKIIQRGDIWEPNIVDLINKYGEYNSTIIDAGAHIGTHTILMSKLVGPEGRVYAFEPQKKIHRELVYNMLLNNAANVVPLRYAVGDEPGIIEMAVASEGNEGATSIGEGGDQAELRTIDSFQFQNVSLMKIDVEGFEDQVLDGAKETILRENPFILIEIQGGNTYETADETVRAKITRTTDKITVLGYQIARIGRWEYLGIPNSRVNAAGIKAVRALQ